jgi:hypothetical protein
MSLQQLSARNGLVCVACNNTFIDNTTLKPTIPPSLSGLADAIRQLQNQPNFEVQFVIPEPNPNS